MLTIDNKEMGRKLEGEEEDLGIGTTKAFFQSEGKEQDEIEELKIKDRGKEME